MFPTPCNLDNITTAWGPLPDALQPINIKREARDVLGLKTSPFQHQHHCFYLEGDHLFFNVIRWNVI